MNSLISLRELDGIDVEVLKGVGEKRKKSLSDFGIETVLDRQSLHHFTCFGRIRRELAAIEVRCDRDKTLIRVTVRNVFYMIVQAPPFLDDDDGFAA